MKHLDEYRDGETARAVVEAIAKTAKRPWALMEVCGGQTHSIVRYGIDRMLPPNVELLHGPGCPVCVTPLEMIDRAHAVAARPGVIFCSFGDMLRVPGSRGDLLSLKASGSDVRVVYSPLDAVRLASTHPDRQVVFFAIGFETTAPAQVSRDHGCNGGPGVVAAVLRQPSTRGLEKGRSTNPCSGRGASGAQLKGDVRLQLWVLDSACDRVVFSRMDQFESGRPF